MRKLLSLILMRIYLRLLRRQPPTLLQTPDTLAWLVLGIECGVISRGKAQEMTGMKFEDWNRMAPGYGEAMTLLHQQWQRMEDD